jgi:hypothetical protein
MNLLSVEFPGDLFSGNKDTLKNEFDKLAHKYHPDINHSPRANDEFIHLQELYKQAQEAIEAGHWETKDSLWVASYHIHFKRKMDLPIGKMYVGDTHVTFLIDKLHESLWENAVNTIERFKYPSERMKKEMSRYFPSIKAKKVLPKYNVLVVDKTPDLLLLRDIPFSTLRERDRHVAWIISTLQNLMCYLEFAGLTHNDISLDTYFISPKYHSSALLGGWWYACKQGHKLKSVPVSSYDLFPPLMRDTKIANHILDKELIRALGRELLGDRTGNKLLASGVAPAPFINWLRCSTSNPAVKEYALWDKVLEQSYGKKKFVDMNVTTKTIYGGK